MLSRLRSYLSLFRPKWPNASKRRGFFFLFSEKKEIWKIWKVCCWPMWVKFNGSAIGLNSSAVLKQKQCTWYWVEKPLPVQQFINPLFAIAPGSSAPILFRTSECWIMQQLDKWSVFEPTWLPSSNREASLRGQRPAGGERVKRRRWKKHCNCSPILL